jgi:hypothetical protein
MVVGAIARCLFPRDLLINLLCGAQRRFIVGVPEDGRLRLVLDIAAAGIVLFKVWIGNTVAVKFERSKRTASQRAPCAFLIEIMRRAEVLVDPCANYELNVFASGDLLDEGQIAGR